MHSKFLITGVISAIINLILAIIFITPIQQFGLIIPIIIFGFTMIEIYLFAIIRLNELKKGNEIAETLDGFFFGTRSIFLHLIISHIVLLGLIIVPPVLCPTDAYISFSQLPFFFLGFHLIAITMGSWGLSEK